LQNSSTINKIAELIKKYKSLNVNKVLKNDKISCKIIIKTDLNNRYV